LSSKERTTVQQLSVKVPVAVTGVRVVAGPVGQAQPAAPRKAAADKSPAVDPEAERRDLASATEALHQACGQVRAAHQEFLKHAERQLVDLAIEIAAKVLMQQIGSQQYQIEPIVREALEKLPQDLDIVVRLNPDDLSRCGDTVLAGRAGKVAFEPDPAVPRGGCRVETPQGLIQSDVAERLAELAEALKGLD